MTLPVYFKLINEGQLPHRATEGSVGYDLFANKTLFIAPGSTARVPLGFAMQMPPELYAMVLPRSSMSARGIETHTGVIDSDYRGELVATMTAPVGGSWLPSGGVRISRGDRVAQLVFHRHERISQFVRPELDDTTRGASGFGSTGR